MDRSKTFLYFARALQIIFAAIVLGVGIKLCIDWDAIVDLCKAAKEHHCGKGYEQFPTATSFAAFTGAFGLVDAIVGLAAAFFSGIPLMAAEGMDGVAAIFYLAGGINSAVRRTKWNKNLDDSGLHLFVRFDTTTAFMFLGLLATLAALASTFLSRKTRKMHSAV